MITILKCYFSFSLHERHAATEVVDAEHELAQLAGGEEDGMNSRDLLVYFIL